MSVDRLLEIPVDIPHKIDSNTLIYKDDCMYCFDTAENNLLGIDICLTCYQSFSRGDINHTAFHSIKSNHNIYLNIVKTLKPESERNRYLNQDGERQTKIAKLEVKDLSDEEIYDSEKKIYNYLNNRTFSFEEISQEFQDLAQSIFESNSSNRKNEISAWEQEVYPCEHSIDLKQFENGSVDLSKCSECSLKENLWICLHCGFIGCGREQFGSSLKGNSHALRHFEASEHPVAVKLGSLTADDENGCDAYCYKCNDEVKVTSLSEKLLKYGIDLKNSVKTEKSLIELNLDQNLNWDFKLDGANGEKLMPVFGPELTGFQNLGNSCYLSSVLQALFGLSSYKSYFKNMDFPDCENPSKNLLSQLIKIHEGLLSGRYSKPNSLKGDDYQSGIKPTSFKTLIGQDHVEFKTSKQQDAFEFLLHLLNTIDRTFGLKLNKEFNYLTANKVICTSCHTGSLNYELSDNLGVNIPDEIIGTDKDGKKLYKEVKFIDVIRDYCSSEFIEGYQCDYCENSSTIAEKQSGFKSFPDILIVNAKRIKLENWVPVKIDVPIEIPDKLDISEFTTPEFDENETEVKQDKNDSSFIPNSEAVNVLLSMGFPEVRYIKALYHTGNKDADDAINWLFAHMDDIDIDEPFNPDSFNSKSSKSENEPSEEAIANLVSMGFSAQLSKKALVLNNNDVNLSVEWLFNNPDDDGVIEQSIKGPDLENDKSELTKSLMYSTSSGNYNLKAVVCHKGTSPHTGHYVVFIKKYIFGEFKWVLFNDEKVVVCDENNLADIKTNAYIYFFEKTAS